MYVSRTVQQREGTTMVLKVIYRNQEIQDLRILLRISVITLPANEVAIHTIWLQMI